MGKPTVPCEAVGFFLPCKIFFQRNSCRSRISQGEVLGKIEFMKTKTKRKWYLLGGGLAFLSAGFLFAFGERAGVLEKLSNYPNPFDSRKEETVITYQLLSDQPVRIRIVDLFGYVVKEFHFSPGSNGARSGENMVRWDGRDESGQKVSKGGYICQVSVEGERPSSGIRKIGVIH